MIYSGWIQRNIGLTLNSFEKYRLMLLLLLWLIEESAAKWQA